ncbi:PAS domain S-box-containing protein [Novosphingobium sp. B1]|nr:PAS domain S-box-containing protein [Novosphingobium sp. B1]
MANAEGRYININPAPCQMLGYAKDELLGLTLLDVLDPSEAARLDETRREMSDLQIHRSEWLFNRKDGSVFVGELVGGQLPDGNLQSIVRDVSERLEREALERTLRQEAAHRTKNVLAVVQTILR